MLPPDDLESDADLEPNEDIIERTAPGEEPLWFWAQTCPDEDCPCRLALMVAASSREQLDAHVDIVRIAWHEAVDSEAYRAAVPKDIVAFELEIDSGEVAMPLAEDDTVPLSPEVVRVATRIDGELLDRLASQWHLGKEQDDTSTEPVMPSEIHDFKPGQLLAWDEVYNGARMDVYALETGPVEAVDTYCVRPKCECNDVHVQFYALDTDELDEDAEDDADTEHGDHEAEDLFIGTVSIKVEESVQMDYSPAEGKGDVLQALFALYQARYPNWVQRLADRAEKMAAFGERLHAHFEQQRRKPWVSTSRKRKHR